MSYVNDKYNKKVNNYTFKCDNPVYCKLADLYAKNGPDHVYILRALYLAEKGDYPHPVAVADTDTFADLPVNMMDQVKEMRADSVLTDLINAGKVGFTIYTYDSKKRKGCYSVDFVDIEPDDNDFPTEINDLPTEIKD